MTNEEAIKGLKKLRSFHNRSYGEHIAMAINALEQRGCVWEIAYERGKVEVLDKIRTEVKALADRAEPENIIYHRIWDTDVLAIIDKYKAESEDAE